MDIFNGYLFSKLQAIGSRSEGPIYYLQQFDYKEFVVLKKVQPWQGDPKLSQFLNKKVTIQGQLGMSGIDYKTIVPYKAKGANGKGPSLIVDLKLGTSTLIVDQMPPGPHPPQSLALTLRVKWPYRSIWTGHLLTTQIYDFMIDHKGKTIWRWSAGKVFGQIVHPISISGGSFHEFPEVWTFDPDSIMSGGRYTARGIFLATGQEATADFKIEIAE